MDQDGRASPGAVGDGLAEQARLQTVYRGYDSDPRYKRIWSGAAARFELEHKWQEIARVLAEEGVRVETARLLDLGAGGGADCERFRGLGFRADRIVAVDLLAEFARGARASHAWLTSIQADASRLPFRAGSFDLVYQSTMISSVLDASWRKRILGEVDRVLAPGGLFLSYDTRYPNPWNRNTRPLTASELRGAFTGALVKVRSTTPIPQLMRLFMRLSDAACRALQKIPPLRSHLLAVIRKT